MNEVRLSPVVDTSAKGTASSAGKSGGVPDVGSSGSSATSEVSAQVVDPREKRAAVADAAINEAVSELNNFVQSEQRDLMFSVDEGSGDVVVRVVDRTSGELIRQIPNDVVLDLAAKARDNEPLQLISMYG